MTIIYTIHSIVAVNWNSYECKMSLQSAFNWVFFHNPKAGRDRWICFRFEDKFWKFQSNLVTKNRVGKMFGLVSNSIADMCSLRNFNKLWTMICVVAAVSTMTWQLMNYLSGQDSTIIQFKGFNKDKADIYPEQHFI